MGTNRSFQDLFNDFLHEVREADKSHEVASNFGPSKSTESMFKDFWGLDEAHQCLDFKILESFKSQSQADLLRKKAKGFYLKGQYDQALKLYNMCIMFAPPPLINKNDKEMITPVNDKDNNELYKSTSLAFGFANRSAVLFEMKLYEKTIKDIDLAIKNGYPVEQVFKLVERKCKCLLKLDKRQDARSLIYSSIHLLSTLDMAESTKQSKRNKLLSFLENLQDDQENSDYEENIPNSVDPIENLISQKTTDIHSNNVKSNSTPATNIPILTSPHPTIYSASSALGLEHTSEKGRFFVAERDIEPGELLLVENSPYSCLYLLKDILHNHCCVCLMKCYNPLPCNKCNMVMFCSEDCQSECLNGHTGVECHALQTLDSLVMGNNCRLAFKVITQLPYMKIKSLIPNSRKQLLESSPILYGFNKNGNFDSSDFLTTYAMVDNLSRRDSDELFKKVAMAFILTKLLIKSDHYFIDEKGFSFQPSDEDIFLIGSTFVTLIMSLQCNAHQIEEYTTMNIDTQTINGVGAAVFPAHSLVNHSCNPGMARSSIGRLMTSYAIRFIPKGTDVTDSYGYHYAVHENKYRLDELRKKYYFECKCEACVCKWTISEIHSSKPKFKSINDTNMNENIEKYKQLKTRFKKTYLEIMNDEINVESKQVLIDFIEFLDMYLILPCKIYHHLQELLKFCIDKESSTKH